MTPNLRTKLSSRAALAALVLGILLAGAIVGVVLAGASGKDDPAPRAADLTALRCPLVPTGKTVDGVAQYAPAKNAFDTAELVGKPIEQARRTAASHGCAVLVSMEDGRGIGVPTDIDPKRILVYTEKGVVTRIEGVGGGI